MSCTKTGFIGYITCYQEWVYGDAFELSGVAYFRIVQRSRERLGPIRHYTISDFDAWFDKEKTSGDRPSTLVTSTFLNHGYDGVTEPNG